MIIYIFYLLIILSVTILYLNYKNKTPEEEYQIIKIGNVYHNNGPDVNAMQHEWDEGGLGTMIELLADTITDYDKKIEILSKSSGAPLTEGELNYRLKTGQTLREEIEKNNLDFSNDWTWDVLDEIYIIRHYNSIEPRYIMGIGNMTKLFDYELIKIYHW